MKSMSPSAGPASTCGADIGFSPSGSARQAVGGRPLLGLFAAVALAGPAWAHHGDPIAPANGFLSGLAHPVTGLDHVLAMLAVGLWAAMLGGRARWTLPGTFVALMLLAAGLGMIQVSLPFVEPGIVASVVVLGLLLAAAWKLPLIAGACLVGLFAVFHGHAHGQELAVGASAAGYMTGFALTTAGLHLAGIALGSLILAKAPRASLRMAGGAIAVAGCALFAMG